MLAKDSKIIQIEAEKDKLRSHNMNISMKLEELRLKYDPGKNSVVPVIINDHQSLFPLVTDDHREFSQLTN